MTGFYLSHPEREQSVIMIRINAFGWRLRRSMDVSVLSKVWDPKRERLKAISGDYAIINTVLEEWTSKANSLIIEHKMKLLRPTLQEFESQLFSGRQSRKIKSIFQVFDELIEEKKQRISKDAVKVYFSAKNYLERFNPKLVLLSENDLADITKAMLKDKMSPNTIAKRIGIYCVASELQTGAKIKRKIIVSQISPDKVYLDLNELQTIIKAKLASKILDEIRDLFVFSCFTGLRYSDILVFDLSFIQTISGKEFIVYSSKKTGNNAVIPIFKEAKRILDKYHGLPDRLTLQTYNEHIKLVCKLSGITNKINFTKLEGERKVPYTVEKYKVIASHTARRSFVSNLLSLGLNYNQIAPMTGHSKVATVQEYDKVKAESNAVNVLELVKGMI